MLSSVRYRKSGISLKAQEEWKPQWWPAPEGALAGLKIEVFWDVDGCDLKNGLDILQHCDVLSALGESSSRDDFHIHIFMSRGKLDNLPHDSKARLFSPEGKSKLLSINAKESPETAAEAQREAMVRYGERARVDDVLVLISDDAYFASTVMRLVNEHHMQFLHLPRTGKNTPGWEQVDVSWQCPWGKFIEYHSKRARYRPSYKENKDNILRIISKSEAQHAAFSEVGIIILIDATKSMQPCIQQIKDRIKDEMLLNLVTRLPHLRNKIFFSVVAYRDVKEKSTDPPEVEIMGHDNSMYPQQKPQQRHFTNNVDDVKFFLESKDNPWRPSERGLIAAGGGDWPEDIASGLTEVSELNFGDEKTISKRACILFHVFNDPGHGKEFNSAYTGCSAKSGEPRDRFYDAPPPGREDPAQEIRKALIKLKGCNVIKYVMLTMNCSPKKEKYPVSPTAQTVAKMKEIAKSVPACGSIDLEKSTDGMREDWVEETFLETPSQERAMDCLPLVKSMIKATTRSMTNASAMSTVSRNTKWHESKEQLSGNIFTSQESPCALREVACYVDLADVRDWMKRPNGPTGLRAAESPMSGLYGLNPDYQRWYCIEGRPALERLATKLVDEINPQEVSIMSMMKPYSVRELIDLVDSQDGGLTVLSDPSNRCMFRIQRGEVFAEGAERSCVLGTEHNSSLALQVFKKFKHDGEGAKSIYRYKKLLSAHCIASFLADEYNKALDMKNVAGPRLKYVDACITTFYSSGKSSKPTKINEFRERFVAGQFRKFTSNLGYNAPPGDAIEACSAFAHWAYVATEGRAMVTDVQGWYDRTANIVLLTDPCFVCTSVGLIDDAFKDTGPVGMESFFRSHSCDNHVCQALGLHELMSVPDALQNIREHIENMASFGTSEAARPRGVNGNNSLTEAMSRAELYAHKAAQYHESMARLHQTGLFNIPEEPVPDPGQPRPQPVPEPEPFPVNPPDNKSALPIIVRLVFPTDYYGSFVGEGGKVVNGISSTTGAEIKPEDLLAGLKESVIMVKAQDRPDAVNCPTEEALVRIISWMAKQEVGGPFSSPEATVKLMINSGFMKVIIGHKSSYLKQMKERMDVSAHVMPPSYRFALMAENEQTIKVSGPFGGVMRALHLIMENFRNAIVEGHLPLVTPQPLQAPSPPTPLPRFKDPALELETVYRILVPEYMIGSLIGTGGENKHHIQSTCSSPLSEAKFNVVPKAEGGANEVVCRSKQLISSQHCGAADLLLECARHVLTKNGELERVPKQVRLLVPVRQIGAVIGKQGVIIKGLAEEFKCKLSHFNKPSKLSVLVIMGLPEDILAAVHRITILLRDGTR